uniref:Uncharacterized protein n=1 Tax=Oryza meridionalis TaxID=40149 RepID=A0A0E0D4N9_9ORYZ
MGKGRREDEGRMGGGEGGVVAMPTMARQGGTGEKRGRERKREGERGKEEGRKGWEAPSLAAATLVGRGRQAFARGYSAPDHPNSVYSIMCSD